MGSAFTMRATHRTDRLQPYLSADGYRVFGIEAQGSRDPTEHYSGSVTIWDWTPRNGDLRSNDGEWVLAQRIEGAQANQRLAFGGFAVSPAGTLMAAHRARRPGVHGRPVRPPARRGAHLPRADPRLPAREPRRDQARRRRL